MKKLGVLLLAILLLALVEINWFNWIPEKRGQELLFFPSGKFLKGLTGGFDTFLADLFWIEAGVYYGRHRLTDREYTYLYHILDVTTDLDPLFIAPYTLGATLLAEDAGRLDLANKLLEKGMYNNPSNWQIPFIKGFIHYFNVRDYGESSKWFLLASQKEDAPDMAVKFASWTLGKSRGIETTLELYLRFYRMFKSDIVKEKVIKGIAKTLSIRAYKFKMDTGRAPKSLLELEKNGYIPFIPEIEGIKVKLQDTSVILENYD